MQIKLLLLIGILLCGVTYGSACSLGSYEDACKNCKFDNLGKMNETCYNKYMASGKTCIAVSHPILASKYKEGKCPQMDTCASELEACKRGVETGNDSTDCNNFLVEACFKESDQCVAKAVEDCGGGLDLSGIEDMIGDFCPFAMILSVVLVGAVYAQSKSIVK